MHTPETPNLSIAQQKMMIESLREIYRNDSTTYAHHQPRGFDGRKPDAFGGTIWLTPREIASNALRRVGLSAPDSFAEANDERDAKHPCFPEHTKAIKTLWDRAKETQYRPNERESLEQLAKWCTVIEGQTFMGTSFAILRIDARMPWRDLPSNYGAPSHDVLRELFACIGDPPPEQELPKVNEPHLRAWFELLPFLEHRGQQVARVFPGARMRHISGRSIHGLSVDLLLTTEASDYKRRRHES
jgi:hypothetical protein